MRPHWVRMLLVATLGVGFAAVNIASKDSSPAALAQGVPASAPPLQWYKGNTHTHTLNSDGDSTPDEVVRWYREHRYHFLVLTDHNFVTSVDGLNARSEERRVGKECRSRWWPEH